MNLVRRLVTAAFQRRPDRPLRDGATLARLDDLEMHPAIGWHESSYELRCGLEVVELEPVAA